MLLGEDEIRWLSTKANENGPRAPFIGTTVFYVINRAITIYNNT